MDAQHFAIALSIPTFDSVPTVRDASPIRDTSPTRSIPNPIHDTSPTQVRHVVRCESGPTLVLRRRPAGTQPPMLAEQAACANAVLEAKLLAILDSPIASIETPTQGFDRKERALGQVFGELSADDAAALLARLAINFTCDALARKFSKLAIERRERLLGFLRHCA